MRINDDLRWFGVSEEGIGEGYKRVTEALVRFEPVDVFASQKHWFAVRIRDISERTGDSTIVALSPPATKED